MAVDETSTYDAPPVPPELWARLDEIDQLRGRATPGEWEADRIRLSVIDDLPLTNVRAVTGEVVAQLRTGFLWCSESESALYANAALIAALHNAWPEVSAHLRRLSERVVYLEQQERQRAVALEGLREENERLQGQRDALRETAMLIVHGPHGGPKLRSNLAALLRVAEACDAALAEGSGDDDA